MKKLFIPLFCLLIGVSTQVNAQTKADIAQQKVEGPQFKFEGGDTHDFGVVKRGPVAMHKFEFTNVGNQSLSLM